MAESKDSDRIRVANRITDMLCRLNEGKGLDSIQLALEHKVSRRTIQRDIGSLREAFPMLDVNAQGHYALPASYLGQLGFDDIRHFAMLVGVAGLFPNMDRQFLRRILDKNARSIYESKGQFNEDGAALKGLFEQLDPAIVNRYRVSIYYKGNYHLIEPYKLIMHHSCWYLAGVKDEKLKAYRLSFVKHLTVHIDQPIFAPDTEILKQLEAEESIWFGQDKQEAILTVSAKVADHFKKRSLLPHQQILKEMNDGGLLVSSQYVTETQIIPLIRYWIPDIHVVSPESLQCELMDGLKGYVG